MNYIKAICRTNLDDYTCNVALFVELPRVGDRVEVYHKIYSGVTLRVVQVTHRVNSDGDPYIVVELNK
jgi:hypothetical protein